MSETQFTQIRMRRLKNELELEAWFDFIHNIFKEKTTRQYFVNHHWNDPYSDLSSILVATIPKMSINITSPTSSLDSEEIVATVKIFHRKIQINNISKNNSMISECQCEGIGEVGTRVDMRRKGISHSLLTLVIQQMKNNLLSNAEFVISSLHAAPSVCEVYRKVGWQSIPMYHSTIHLSVSCFMNDSNESHKKFLESIAIDKLDFSSQEEIQEVMQLYSKFCKTYQFHGCEVRGENTEYWSKWVDHESTTHQCSALALYSNSNITAYLIIGPDLSVSNSDKHALKVKEFVCNSDFNSEKCWLAFSTLLTHYLLSSLTSEQKLQTSITLPHALLLQVFKELYERKESSTATITMDLKFQIIIDGIKEKSVTDIGYMYRMIQPEDNHLLNQLIHEDKHLVWKTDGF
ncbi:hypothetical protein FDP41_006665 [Naegleria fowleri]|uniref:Uncharacterized protein n=1 Tax=Naegleria fowleri TaxID=5763 RepID=A0A6A5BKA4_NAEFO|nr:uncharacterized protein FDP41_006665 [Naegleria fowleri]KAF0974055.1 hypothetical protein FDP41_006665 [Naegleria fowleri]CAG4712779.1 unnamed protein product [Naegleria fowleri]